MSPPALEPVLPLLWHRSLMRIGSQPRRRLSRRQFAAKGPACSSRNPQEGGTHIVELAMAAALDGDAHRLELTQSPNERVGAKRSGTRCARLTGTSPLFGQGSKHDAASSTRAQYSADKRTRCTTLASLEGSFLKCDMLLRSTGFSRTPGRLDHPFAAGWWAARGRLPAAHQGSELAFQDRDKATSRSGQDGRQW